MKHKWIFNDRKNTTLICINKIVIKLFFCQGLVEGFFYFRPGKYDMEVVCSNFSFLFLILHFVFLQKKNQTKTKTHRNQPTGKKKRKKKERKKIDFFVIYNITCFSTLKYISNAHIFTFWGTLTIEILVSEKLM